MKDAAKEIQKVTFQRWENESYSWAKLFDLEQQVESAAQKALKQVGNTACCHSFKGYCVVLIVSFLLGSCSWTKVADLLIFFFFLLKYFSKYYVMLGKVWGIIEKLIPILSTLMSALICYGSTNSIFNIDYFKNNYYFFCKNA